MIGMSSFQGLFNREARVLVRVNPLLQTGVSALDAASEARAAVAFVKALSLLEVREPTARFDDYAKAFADVGEGLLRVGRLESGQAAANHAMALDRGNVSALALQADILVAQDRATDALGYYEIALQVDRKAKELWERKGDAQASRGQAPAAVRAYMQAVSLDPDDTDG